ncbi:hypothetical protein DENSPDRAFT_855426 [Dentipellis sp. KUC8613]|nr:hypothetical protein DENSPDRAFT_855426 [Dentipellis sp. KUC8613]
MIIELTQYTYIQDAMTALQAWAALAKIYKKNMRANHIMLKQQFYLYQHNPNALIREYIAGITTLASCLHGIGVSLLEDDIIDVLIFNLEKEWSNIGASLCSSESLTTMSQASAMLISKEGRWGGPPLEYDTDPTIYAAKSGKSGNHRTGSITCFRCKKTGHMAQSCRAPAPAEESEGADLTYNEEDYAW